jgi:hypothetical protein
MDTPAKKLIHFAMEALVPDRIDICVVFADGEAEQWLRDIASGKCDLGYRVELVHGKYVAHPVLETVCG